MLTQVARQARIVDEESHFFCSPAAQSGTDRRERAVSDFAVEQRRIALYRERYPHDARGVALTEAHEGDSAPLGVGGETYRHFYERFHVPYRTPNICSSQPLMTPPVSLCSRSYTRQTLRACSSIPKRAAAAQALAASVRLGASGTSAIAAAKACADGATHSSRLADDFAILRCIRRQHERSRRHSLRQH